mgnify:CR=1 FL=1
MGAYVRENRSGRTSHDSFPGVIVHTEQTNESSGSAYGLHLGWSGNHHVRVEEQFTGQAYAQMGELFLPGEMLLEPGQAYKSPVLIPQVTAFVPGHFAIDPAALFMLLVPSRHNIENIPTKTQMAKH